MSSDETVEAVADDVDDGPAKVPPADLAEDARALVAAVESIHPDPYRGYDGRVELHRRLEKTVRDARTATREECYRRLAPLVAGMDDAHSVVRPPDRDGEDRRLPLSFRIVGDGLYVESTSDRSRRDLLGTRVVDVEGTPIETLAERGARLRGAENRYTALSYVSRAIEDYDALARLLDRSAPPAEPTLGVVVDGERRRRTLAPVSGDAEPVADLETTIRQPTGPGPRYRLYEGGEAALFVPGDLSVYRESLEAFVRRDGDAAADLATRAHEEVIGGDRPDDLEATIARLPSMIETLTDLVSEMEAAGTRSLIVDLRDNPGGDSQFVDHLAYVLYGWDGVATTSDAARAVKRRTDRHRERYGAPDDASGTADANRADYDFPTTLWEADRDRLIEWSRDRLTDSETFAAEAADGTHEARYEPERVVVAIDAGTFSSAFAAAAQLGVLGADLVGVPSGQAPISFGEAVEETLPNTGLTARIACSMFRWVPDPDGDVLPMDRELTPELFDRYGRAADAPLRLAFDHAGIAAEVPEPA